MSTPLIPLVDPDTKLLPQPTVDALIAVIAASPQLLEAIQEYLTENPVETGYGY